MRYGPTKPVRLTLDRHAHRAPASAAAAASLTAVPLIAASNARLEPGRFPAVAAKVVVVGKDEVPPVVAILAAVDDDIAGIELAVLARMRDQVAHAAAVDAIDLRLGLHAPTLPDATVGPMRIVAGSARGRRILAPPGTGTRPTSDRVREAMFNALGSLGVIEGARVVDLFAGSGALGLEALSRGADHVVFVERDRATLAVIRTNIDTLGFADRATVQPGDALDLAGRVTPADLVLCDPPYEFDRWDELVAACDAPVVVAESNREIEAPPGWELTRQKRYGTTVVTILSADTTEPPE